MFFLNMVGMPLFYVFMIRRYLGLEGGTTEADDVALDRFLKLYALSRDGLSSDQVNVLRAYCRKCRLTKWGVAPMIVVASLMLYTAVVFVPKNSVQLFSGLTPSRVVIVNPGTNEKMNNKTKT